MHLRGPIGRLPAQSDSQIRLYYLLAHGWDLARARDNPSSFWMMWPKESLT